MSNRDRMTDQIAELLEQSGCTPNKARALAEKVASVLRAVSPGCDYGPLHPQDLARIWQRAARVGRRRLVLEITAEARELKDDTGRVNVRVLDAESWPEWTPEHTRQRAATDALLRHTPAPALEHNAQDAAPHPLDPKELN